MLFGHSTRVQYSLGLIRIVRQHRKRRKTIVPLWFSIGLFNTYIGKLVSNDLSARRRHVLTRRRRRRRENLSSEIINANKTKRSGEHLSDTAKRHVRSVFLRPVRRLNRQRQQTAAEHASIPIAIRTSDRRRRIIVNVVPPPPPPRRTATRSRDVATDFQRNSVGLSERRTIYHPTHRRESELIRYRKSVLFRFINNSVSTHAVVFIAGV